MAIVTLDETILIKFICYDCGHIWDENFEGDSDKFAQDVILQILLRLVEQDTDN